MLYLIWGRDVDLAKDLDDALQTAWWHDESEEDWFDAIEVVASDGTSEKMTKAHPVVAAEFDRRTEEAWQRYRQQQTARPFRGNIRVDGRTLESLYGDADPETKMAELRLYLGDRVTFEAYKVSR